MSTDPERLDGQTVEAAQAHLLDTLGMMFAGATKLPSWALQYLDALTAGPRLAFRFSLQAGALGLDDFDEATRAHPGAVIVPAMVAAALRGSSSAISGGNFIAGLVVGYRTLRSLGRAMGAPRLHAMGYHPSAILGAPAAALAIGRMRGLDADGLRSCLGIGASTASGIGEFDSDDRIRAFQSAWAASSAWQAAELACAGLPASEQSLEGERGLVGRLLRPAGDYEVPEVPEASVQRVSFKPFPHFSDLHPATSALIDLLNQHRPDPDDIVEVELQVDPQIQSGLTSDYPPRSAKTAKRSAPWCAAAVVLAGQGQPVSVASATAALSSTALDDARVVAWGERVRLRADLTEPSDGPSARVRLTLRNGTTHEASAVGYPGDGRRDELRWGMREVSQRFDEMVSPSVGQDVADRVAEFVRTLPDHVDIRDAWSELGIHLS